MSCKHYRVYRTHMYSGGRYSRTYICWTCLWLLKHKNGKLVSDRKNRQHIERVELEDPEFGWERYVQA